MQYNVIGLYTYYTVDLYVYDNNCAGFALMLKNATL